MSWIRRRLAAQDGFTLVELLMAMSIGTIVLMAAFYTLDRAGQIQREAADRSDALQRGRIALELVTRELRSQVCLGTATEPITDGRATSVEFYADMSDGSATPEKRKIAYDATKKTIIEYRYARHRHLPRLDLLHDAGIDQGDRLRNRAAKGGRGRPADLQVLRVGGRRRLRA